MTAAPGLIREEKSQSVTAGTFGQASKNNTEAIAQLPAACSEIEATGTGSETHRLAQLSLCAVGQTLYTVAADPFCPAPSVLCAFPGGPSGPFLCGQDRGRVFSQHTLDTGKGIHSQSIYRDSLAQPAVGRGCAASGPDTLQ